MKNKIPYINWHQNLIQLKEVESIGHDFFLFDKIRVFPEFYFPFKVDVTTIIFCLQGSIKGLINNKHYTIYSPGVQILLADQILQFEELSDDFDGRIIVISKHFTDNLFTNVQDRLQMYNTIKDRPITQISHENKEILQHFYFMFHKIVSQHDNPRRLMIARHLTLAFFYLIEHQLPLINREENKLKNEILLDNFLILVQKNIKQERNVEYYANKLSFTTKYFSSVIRQISGKTATEWIELYLLFEAKILLKSSNKTILQISDELGFTDQSLFGKYFKRLAGISPKEFREK